MKTLRALTIEELSEHWKLQALRSYSTPQWEMDTLELGARVAFELTWVNEVEPILNR